MLKYLLALCLTTWAVADVPAQQSTSQPNLSNLTDAAQIVEAETGVTRDAIAQMLQGMLNSSAEIQFNATDYRAKSAAFQRRVSAVLQQFETNLRNSILPRAAALIDRYNAIYNSTTLSAAQKQNLLHLQLRLMSEEWQVIKEDYRNAVRAVYSAADVVPPMPRTRDEDNIRFLQRRRSGCPRGSTSFSEHYYEVPGLGRVVTAMRCFAHDRNNYVIRTGEIPGANDDQVFRVLVYPQLQRGCRSQVCLSLSATEAAQFLSFVRNNIDRDIRLASIRVPMDGEEDYEQEMILDSPHKNIEFVTSLLEQTYYPSEGQALPFDTE